MLGMLEVQCVSITAHDTRTQRLRQEVLPGDEEVVLVGGANDGGGGDE